MASLSLAVLLELSILAPGAETYAEAYHETTKTGRPMVVLVGAEWCSACEVMKREVIPQVRRRGLLGRVAFAVVNVDREKALGHKLTCGGPIPQLLMFCRTPSGWRRSRLTGGHSAGTVEAFIDSGLKRDAATKKTDAAPEEQPPEGSSNKTAGESAEKIPPVSNS